jgi:hypothetical protein
VNTRRHSAIASALLTTLTASLAVSLCACSSNSPATGPAALPPPVLPAVSDSSAAPSDPRSQAEADVLDAYRRLITVTTKELATDTPDPDRAKYASGDAFVFFNTVLSYRYARNIVYVGTPQTSPVVTALDLTSNPPSATVWDCFGGPGYTPVFAAGPKKGQSAVIGGTPVARHPQTAKLQKISDLWMVVSMIPPSSPSQTC